MRRHPASNTRPLSAWPTAPVCVSPGRQSQGLRHRQQAHADPRRAGERQKGSTRNVLATAVGDPAGLLVGREAKAVAISRQGAIPSCPSQHASSTGSSVIRPKPSVSRSGYRPNCAIHLRRICLSRVPISAQSKCYSAIRSWTPPRAIAHCRDQGAARGREPARYADVTTAQDEPSEVVHRRHRGAPRSGSCGYLPRLRSRLA